MIQFNETCTHAGRRSSAFGFGDAISFRVARGKQIVSHPCWLGARQMWAGSDRSVRGIDGRGRGLRSPQIGTRSGTLGDGAAFLNCSLRIRGSPGRRRSLQHRAIGANGRSLTYDNTRQLTRDGSARATQGWMQVLTQSSHTAFRRRYARSFVS